MLIELAHFCLVLTFIGAAAQCSMAAAGLRRVSHAAYFVTAATATARAVALVTALSFALLCVTFVVSDFSAVLAWQHSSSAKPLIYRISATWGNHEGSLLLWTTMVAVLGAIAVCARARALAASADNAIDQSAAAASALSPSPPAPNLPQLRRHLLIMTLMLGLIVLFISAVVLFTSNPFLRLFPKADEGLGLNPILQHPALAIHPPLVYGGHAALAVVFAYATAATNPQRCAILRETIFRKWVAVAWCLSTAGLAVGSWWAYHELGWGGWWFWDPVENAALLPWLMTNALLHCLYVLQRRGALVVWVIGLSISAFALAVLGTFLVRSGLLESVHSFASDTTRGIAIIIMFMALVGAACFIYTKHYPALRDDIRFAALSREALLVLNNVAMVLIAAIVLLGTTYPLIIQAVSGATTVVGAPYYNWITIPLILPVLLLSPLGPAVAWKKDLPGRVATRFTGSAGLTMLAGFALVLLIANLADWLAQIAALVGCWLILASGEQVIARWRARHARGERWRHSLRALAYQTPWRAHLAHAALGLAIIGMVGTTAWSSRTDITFASTTDGHYFNGYQLKLTDTGIRERDNFRERYAVVGFFAAQGEQAATSAPAFVMEPSRRLYGLRGVITTEMASRTTLAGTTISLLDVAEPASDDGSAVRVVVIYQPLAWMLWFGAALMIATTASGLLRSPHKTSAPPADGAAAQNNPPTAQNNPPAAPPAPAATRASSNTVATAKSKHLAIALIAIALLPLQDVSHASTNQDISASEVERVYRIARSLRCPVCDGEPVSDSSAPVARTMRRFIAQQVRIGKTDDEIIAQIERVYGAEVHMTPPFSIRTYGLWLTPLVFVAAALWLLRRRISAPPK